MPVLRTWEYPLLIVIGGRGDGASALVDRLSAALPREDLGHGGVPSHHCATERDHRCGIRPADGV